MILCLHVDPVRLRGGIFDGETLKQTFSRSLPSATSSDELGFFLRNICQNLVPHNKKIRSISCCSTHPPMTQNLISACKSYLQLSPFILQAGVKTGLKIKYRNPLEVGSDRIADVIAATKEFPDQNILIVNLDTIHSFCAVSKHREYLGDVIFSGLEMMSEELSRQIPKFPIVDICAPKSTIGRSVEQSIQAGLYWGTLGMIKELTTRVCEDTFRGESVTILGTGPYAHLFRESRCFHCTCPDLTLHGLRIAQEVNLSAKKASTAKKQMTSSTAVSV